MQMNPEGPSSATFNQKAWVAVDTDACFEVCRIDAVDDLIISYSADAKGGGVLGHWFKCFPNQAETYPARKQSVF